MSGDLFIYAKDLFIETMAGPIGLDISLGSLSSHCLLWWLEVRAPVSTKAQTESQGLAYFMKLACKRLMISALRLHI
jgi:hypothetical protein